MSELGDLVDIQVMRITVTKENGGDVANFLGATTYTKMYSRLMDWQNSTIDDEFTVTGYCFSIPEEKAIFLDVNVTIVKPLEGSLYTIFHDRHIGI